MLMAGVLNPSLLRFALALILSVSFLEVMCVAGGPDLEGMGGVSERA